MKSITKSYGLVISLVLVLALLVSCWPVNAQNLTDFAIQESLTGINYDDSSYTYPVQSGEYVTFYPFGVYNTFATTNGQSYDCSGTNTNTCGGMYVIHVYYTSNYDETLTKHTVYLRILYASPTQVNAVMDTYITSSFHSLKIAEANGWIRLRSNLQLN